MKTWLIRDVAALSEKIKNPQPMSHDAALDLALWATRHLEELSQGKLELHPTVKTPKLTVKAMLYRARKIGFAQVNAHKALRRPPTLEKV